MNKIRTITILLLLLCLLSACKNQQGDKIQIENRIFDKNHIFREEELNLDLGGNTPMQIKMAGETLYVETIRYPEWETEESEDGESTEEVVEGGSLRVITAYDLKGNEQNELAIKFSSEMVPGALAVDNKGNIYSSYSIYGVQEDGSEKTQVYLQSHSPAGEEVFTILLNQEQTDEYFYVNTIYCLSDDTVLIETGTSVMIYDNQGNQIKQIRKGDGESEERLLPIREERFILMGMEGDKTYYETIDIHTGQKGERKEFPFVMYAYALMPGKYYDLYLSDDKGVYGYNLEEDKLIPIMDFLASNVLGYGFYNLQFVDQESFVALYSNDSGTIISHFIHIPAEEVVEKKELTLGCNYLDSDLKMQVIQFNKKNPFYQIKILDYSEYNTMEDYTLGQSRFNSDIASGNIPDIILLQNGMPIESYMAKGIFADYYTLMEEDPSFNREDYLPNLFKAYETKGKLYQMVPQFSINTFAGKTKDVGEDFQWTMDEALRLTQSKPEGTVLFPDVTRDEFVQWCLTLNDEEYINWETGECFFDTEQFMEMLTYAKTLPKVNKQIDYDDHEAFLEMELQYREGRSILAPVQFSTFQDYGNLKYAMFGEEITLVGFPTEKGMGSSFLSQFNLAISEYSENKEAAWEFVKSLLGEEYQDSLEYSFPVRLSSLEKLEKKSWEKPYYLDGKGNKVEYDIVYYVGNMELPGDPVTKEETAVVRKFIESIERTGTYNQEIYHIVSEESSAFFEGQKSVEETVDIIQSRIRIYVNENR